MKTTLQLRAIEDAYDRLKDIVSHTPLQRNARLSEKYQANVYLKREDLQIVRSYKLRGAFNAIVSLDGTERERGIVCASAGNHAQGVAFSCNTLKVRGTIYMPRNTPQQKVERVRVFGGDFVTIVLLGETYDDSFAHAKEYCTKENKVFIHPFDNADVIAGQATVGVEIFAELGKKIDYLVVPVGGGGLIAGLGIYAKEKKPDIKIIGVEPEGAPSMSKALRAGMPVLLDTLDTFIDGTAVRKVGTLPFEIAQTLIESMELVPEGKVCEEMISLYQSDGIIAEPAGALSVAVLDQLKEKIRGKTVVCVISGGNNDISRYAEVMERSLVYRGLKHYFLIEFSQKPGALREYLDYVLGAHDDITLFEYIKKSNKETGPALVGIELSQQNDLAPLLERMTERGLRYELVTKGSPLFRFLF